MKRQEKVIAALAATYFPAMPQEAAAATAEGKDQSLVKYFHTQGDEIQGLTANVRTYLMFTLWDVDTSEAIS